MPIPKMARVPWDVLIIKNPQLGAGKSLDLVKAVFVAGYLCHLQADWFWIKEIFEPIFGPHQKWGIFSKRLYWHNILRAYLDVQVIADLPVEQMGRVGPRPPGNWRGRARKCSCSNAGWTTAPVFIMAPISVP